MKHHIIVKWNEKVTDKKALLPDIQKIFDGTLEIPGIHAVSLVPNIIDRPNRYDLMIVISMDEEALPVYDKCSYHHQWKDNYGALIESKAIFDSED
ncbi:MAG: hypothetical protein MJ175_11415 [Clostridia bacterium]|nr:hypothetical protein [Clostridia bacterium]